MDGVQRSPSVTTKNPTKKATKPRRRPAQPRTRKMKYVNREKVRDIVRLRHIIGHMNSNSEEHYMLVVSAHDPRKHLSFFGSKPLIRAALQAQFRNHISHDQNEQKETLYVPYVRDIGAAEIENLNEHQLNIGIAHMLDLYNYPMKQHYYYKKNKSSVEEHSRHKPKPLFWPNRIKFANFQQILDPNDLVEDEFVEEINLENKRQAMKLVFTSMLRYYKRVLARLYNDEFDPGVEIDLTGLSALVDNRYDQEEEDGEGEDEFINVDDAFDGDTGEPEQKRTRKSRPSKVQMEPMGANLGVLLSAEQQGAAMSHIDIPLLGQYGTVSDKCPLSVGQEEVVESGHPSTSAAGPSSESDHSPLLSELVAQMQGVPMDTPVALVSPRDSLYRMVNSSLHRAIIEVDGTTETGSDGKLYKFINGIFRPVYCGASHAHLVVIAYDHSEDVPHGSQQSQHYQDYGHIQGGLPERYAAPEELGHFEDYVPEEQELQGTEMAMSGGLRVDKVPAPGRRVIVHRRVWTKTELDRGGFVGR